MSIGTQSKLDIRTSYLPSTPIIGTIVKRTKDAMNNGTTNFISNSVLIVEIKIIIVTAKNVKIRCFVKKK